MAKKASIKYRSLRSNLVHLPLSLYASLAQQQTRPQGIILHLSPIVSPSGSRKASEAYLGWSGLAAASSLAGGIAGMSSGKEAIETVEVDPEVAMGLGWPEGTIVEISIIHNPTKARSVSVTPLTPDDWEILEQHASFLEENLLSQLRAARKGQEIDVWVRGRTRIRIRVDDTDPRSSTSAALIHPDTEIFVAPRPRNGKVDEETTQITQPSSAAPSTSAKGKEKAINGAGKRDVRVRMVPQHVAVQWGQPSLSPEDSAQVGNDRVMLCASDVLVRCRRRLNIQEKGPILVRATVEGFETEEDRKPGPTGEVLPDAETKNEGLDVWMNSWDELPDGCVVLSGKVEKEWEGWNTVRISAATAQVGRRKSTKRANPSIELPMTISVNELAGVTEVLEDSLAYLRRTFASQRPAPLLLLGAKGSGKTSLAQRIGSVLETDRQMLTEIVHEDVARIDAEGRISATKEKMTSWLQSASRKAPALLILDGLDTLLAPENELTPSSSPAALANHFRQLISPDSLPSGVLVLVTATSANSIHGLLASKHVFGETIKIPAPTKEVRNELLKVLVKRQNLSDEIDGSTGIDLDFVTLGSMTEGYTAADLKDLVGGALQQAVIRASQADEKPAFSHEDFVAAQEAFTPLSLRGASLQKSDVNWSDIGGLNEPRRVLRETLEWPTKYAQIFANCPLRLRSGLLLYGYPGCGKTLLASAVAKECGLNFISVKGPEILNKYIGASEKSVRDLFERASAAKPCILFFDEFDSIAPKRGHDSTGVTDRVVNQLLTEMDGAQGLEGVYVLAATSRPDLIDPALLRPGRLDKSLLCDMPSTSDRLEILRAVSSKLELDPSIDFDMIADETQGLSGADLQAVIYNAHLEVVQASIAQSAEGESNGLTSGKGKGKGKGKSGKQEEKSPVQTKAKAWKQIAPSKDEKRNEDPSIDARIDAILANSAEQKHAKDEERKTSPKPIIKQKHIMRSLANTRPSVSVTDRNKLERIYRAFVSDRDGAMQNGDLGRDTGTRVSLG